MDIECWPSRGLGMEAAGWIDSIRHRSFPSLLPASNWGNMGTAVAEDASLREVCQPGAME